MSALCRILCAVHGGSDRGWAVPRTLPVLGEGALDRFIDPVSLFVLTVWLLVCIYCVGWFNSRSDASPTWKPYLNLVVLLTGPIGLGVIACVEHRVFARGGVGRLAEVLHGLLRRDVTTQSVNVPRIELCSSDGVSISTAQGAHSYLREPAARRAVETSEEIVLRAIEQGASDILIDPSTDRSYRLRYRVDGFLRAIDRLDAELGSATVNVLKVLAGMDIAERRRPQDGAFMGRLPQHSVNFRTATAGTLYGEKMAVRVLDSKAGLIELSQLGLSRAQLHNLASLTRRSDGTLIVCGPTGSGKTTTLYALLGRLDASSQNIVTIEDPIEYPLENASQRAINPKADITFANALRSILRQDPDVIMVGEMRDTETARMALQAAETGHLVFSTLHSNDSLVALLRLLDLGVEPFLITAGLRAILAQRLVRVLCRQCRRKAAVSPQLAEQAAQRAIPIDSLYQPVGCEACAGTGYRGRTGIFELLLVEEQVSEMLRSAPSLSRLREYARESGLVTLKRDGIAKVIGGITSIDEVVRVTAK